MADRTEDADNWYEISSKLSKLLVHDIKNPISALSANLSFLNRALDDASEDLQSAISDSILALDMLLRFSDNFQQIARLENSENAEMNDISMESFVRLAADRNQRVAESAGVLIEIADPIVRVDCTWQRRYADLAIDNLIMCAVRHCPKGNRVVLSAVREGEDIRLSVSDQGYPVSMEFIETLFTREGQADAKNHSGSRYGRGLGLYAVGLAAVAIGAQLDVVVKNDWNEFSLILPEKSLKLTSHQ